MAVSYDGRVSHNIENVMNLRKVLRVGYHAYRDIWAAIISEEFMFQSEQGNTQDMFSVVVLKDGDIVVHLPWK